MRDVILLGILAAIPVFSFAQHDVSPRDTSTGCPQDTVLIPLNLTFDPGGPDIDAFGLHLHYPTGLLAFDAVLNKGTLTEAWMVAGFESPPGVITIGGYDTLRVTTSGVLVNVRFTVKNGSGQGWVSLTDFVDDIAGGTTTNGLYSMGDECAECVNVSLNEGWNLISFNLAPGDSSVDSVTAPILDYLTVVRGFDLLGVEHGQGADGGLTYDPTLPPAFSSLKWMGCQYGYWVKVTEACTLTVCGNRCPCGEPLALNRGWNLIGYLPEESNQVGTALDSALGGDNINTPAWTGSYRVVRGFDLNGLSHGQGANGGLTFDPTLPGPFSSLKCLMKAFGYWVKLYSDAPETTLVYPCGAGDCPP